MADSDPLSDVFPLSGMRVLELGSRTTAPYLAKLFVDAGADVVKVESPRGDPFRTWSASGATVEPGRPSAWFSYLNAGKASVLLDLDSANGVAALWELVADVDLVIDDHQPDDAVRLGIRPADFRHANPAAVVATLTPFGTVGPWADRPANEFTLQALTGATNGRGLPNEEPLSVGGELGDFISAALSAPAVAAATLAARTSGVGAHIDISRFESMIWSFQIFRALYDSYAPEYRVNRQIEIPSIEPTADGLVGFCTITAQQWQDFCIMIGAPEMGADPSLARFDGRMRQRDKVWEIIRSFTTAHSTDELVELATAFRIPAGPVGTGDQISGFDHFVDQATFATSPDGVLQPCPAYRFSASTLAPLRSAPPLGSTAEPFGPRVGDPRLGHDTKRPLAGLKVLDLTAYFAGPYAANLLRILGADLVKVESHVRLDGMRWASGLTRPQLWEWSPGYHGVNAGKQVMNLDLSRPEGRDVLETFIAEADVLIENFSPRVMENWGLTTERLHEIKEDLIVVRMPAFGTEGPWRDRVGFAMTMEQVSGLANRTGQPDGPPLVPKGPVDFLAGSHAAFGIVLALAERERTGQGQVVESPLITGALQASAEQVVEWSAYGNVLTRTANRSPAASPQGVYPCSGDDVWMAISIESDQQWTQACDVIDGLAGLDRHKDVAAIDEVIGQWTRTRAAEPGAAELWTVGVPAAAAVDFNDTRNSAQLHQRGFYAWFEHPVTGWGPLQHYPFQIDGQYLPLGGPAPTLGQHSIELLESRGFDPEAIAALVSANITGDWPDQIPRPAGSEKS